MMKRVGSFVTGFVIFFLALFFNVPSQTDIAQEALEGISQSRLCDEGCVKQVVFAKIVFGVGGFAIMVLTVLSLSESFVRWFYK
jgi:hypothetical protein